MLFVLFSLSLAAKETITLFIQHFSIQKEHCYHFHTTLFSIFLKHTSTGAIYPVKAFLANALVSSMRVFAFLRRVTFERPFKAFINI